MRALPTGAVFSSELLWWELLLDASQCWGNRIKKSFLDSCNSVLGPAKHEAVLCRQAQAISSAVRFVDNGEHAAKNISRVSDGTLIATSERFRKLFPESHEGPRNACGYMRTIIQEGSIRSGAKDGLQALPFCKWDAGQARLVGNGCLAVELLEKMQQKGVRLNKAILLSMFKACTDAEGLGRDTIVSGMGQNAAGYDENNSVVQAASVLERAFTEMYVKHGCLEEANFVLENFQIQLLSWDTSAAETGLGRLGRLLHNHVISTELDIDICFWSALIDLYAKCGMLVDAYDVLERLGNSLAVPLITGYEALPGESFKGMQQDGEHSNDRMNPSFLPWSHGGQEEEGQHVVTDKSLKPSTKHVRIRASLSGSPRSLKETRVMGRSLSSIIFGRALSTSTEKQCDEDAGEQQSSIQPSSSQQQSSLEIPQSKPEGGLSWPNPDNAASYVLMSNIYADGDRWDEVKRINEMRLKARAWKKPGKAYVEIKAKVHEFIVGDRTHQDSTNIYEKLRKIKRHMGHIGYVPNVDLILENRSYYDPYKPR